MEDLEIINLWKSYGKRLDESLLLNKKNTEDITKMKVQSLLSSMKPLKVFAILVGIVWVAFVDVLIFKLFHVANPFFIVSAIIQAFLTQLAIVIYLYQLILIYQADLNEPILSTQSKLVRLKSSTLWVARLLFLQLPVWTTFYWNKGMLENGNISLWIIQIMITLLFTLLALWLFINIKFENRDKKWFKMIFNTREWTAVIKSMELYREIGKFQEFN
jgi:hypothetical protein